MRKIWCEHSLSIIAAGLGAILFLCTIPIPEGKWFDLVLGLGHGCVTVALINFLAGYFRERNKPED